MFKFLKRILNKKSTSSLDKFDIWFEEPPKRKRNGKNSTQSKKTVASKKSAQSKGTAKRGAGRPKGVKNGQGKKAVSNRAKKDRN